MEQRQCPRCNKCKLWVQAKCSGVKGSLGKVQVTFICKKYVNDNVEARRVNKEKVNNVVDGVEIVENFCYCYWVI